MRRSLPPALLALLLALLPAAPAAADDYVLIVHPGNPVTALTREEVAAIFLKKVPTWPDGTAVVPVDQVGTPVHERFCREVLGKSPGGMRAYWQQRIFSGRAVPPASRPTDAAVVEFVASRPGAIGYIFPAASPGAAKVVTLR